MNKALLLVVDVQKGFVTTAETKAVVLRINKLVEQWKKDDWPIVYSRFVNLENSNWERLRDWHELKQEPDTQLVDELTVVSPYIFKKSTYTAWSSEVAAVCFSHTIEEVVIVGVDTNECVLATALSVFDSGLTPWIVEDCCASSGGDMPHQKALDLLKPLLGEQQIITSKEITHE
jgi:nicotinamidase-related amidase